MSGKGPCFQIRDIAARDLEAQSDPFTDKRDTVTDTRRRSIELRMRCGHGISIYLILSGER